MNHPAFDSAQPSAAGSKRARRYHRTRRVLGVAGYLVDLAALLVLLFTGWTIELRSYAERFSPHFAVALLAYLVLFGLLFKTLGLPLDFARGFWLEHRYGLSNLTLSAWVKDQLKELAVSAALGLPAVEFLYWAMRRWPAYWWLIAGTAFTAFFALLANLAPILIFPLFFKFKPLENPNLTARLLALCERAGTRVKGVFEWKLSEKTKKGNAALMGLGNTRRIILADTLLENFSDDEAEAVLAHELGHHVHRDVLRGLAVEVLTTYLGFYLVSLALARLTRPFGFRGLADFANLPLVALVGAVLALLLLPAVNAHSRLMERRADAYALRAIPQKQAFISSMQKLAEMNLAERQPHPLIEFIFYSHPSIEKRIEFAQRGLAGGK